jgi:GNAT superfamily N-acetyltransferase
MLSVQVALAPVMPDDPGFDLLLAQSLAEGHRMLLRFEENWHSGANRFDRPGELILGATYDGKLLRICGRNVDPYDPTPRAGRVRHLYVEPASRRDGLGRILIGAILDGARQHFDYLNTNAPAGAFAFYERLGFVRRLDIEHITHRLPL